MKTVRIRDIWLIGLLAAIELGLGFSQATADRSLSQQTNYSIAISSGPELRLLGGQDEIPTKGQALVCERIIDLALASLGHNCRPTIRGIAAIPAQ